MASTKNHKKTGFTLIEVVLFLAITGAVLIAILSGTSRSLAQQRYNDSIQDLFSFLQSQYSAVINVQNSSGKGNSTENAIYGKLIVFEGDISPSSGGSIIDVYTVQGEINYDKKKTTIDDIFNSLNLAALCEENTSYITQWGATIQSKNKGDNLKQTIVILRSPTNGNVYTYKSNNNEAIVKRADCQTPSAPKTVPLTNARPFSEVYSLATSSNNAVDLCVYTDDAPTDKRRNIRISSKNSINSIYLIPLDIKEYDQSNDDEEIKNKCQ